jgi:MinD superfamily P-loop ATPase
MLTGVTVAVASGKGGTGKTTVSANLALAAAGAGCPVCYVDCDVEEPNGHLFLHPRITDSRRITVPVPVVDEEKCLHCGACGEICQFGAIVCLNETVLIFDKMCHGCGGCAMVCPAGAITEQGREIGAVEEGRSGLMGFVHGRLQVGEAMSPPLIKSVLSAGPKDAFRIIDAPPGTSCPVITSIKGADFVILVTEPTPFGVNDLGLALDVVRELRIPHGVVVNRWEPDYDLAGNYCREREVGILAEIPDDRRVARAYSNGGLAYHSVPGYRKIFDDLLSALRSVALR